MVAHGSKFRLSVHGASGLAVFWVDRVLGFRRSLSHEVGKARGVRAVRGLDGLGV